MSRSSGASFRLESLNGEHAAELAPGPVVIGSDPGCDLPIPDDRAVSRFHCSVLLLAGGRTVLVTDLGSDCGTWINGQPIERESNLEPGDTLSVGNRSFRLVGDKELNPGPTSGIETAEIPPPPQWLRPRTPATSAHRTAAIEALQSVVFRTVDMPPPAGAAVEEQRETQPLPTPVVPAESRPDGFPPRAARRMVSPVRPQTQEPVNLSELVAMERRALPIIPFEGDEQGEATSQANWSLPLGSVSHPKPGRKWKAVRNALCRLCMILTVSLLVISAVVGVVLTRAFIVLARTGFSVFIPFERGGPQFHDAELMQIGIAAGCVGGTPVLLFLMASKFADEMTMLVLAGLGTGVALGFVYGSSHTADTWLAASALIVLGAMHVAAAVLVARSIVAPVDAAERLGSGFSAMLLAGTGISLIFSLRAGARDIPAFEIPAATAPLATPLLLAIACLVVAMPLFMLLLRRVALRYGDEPTRAAINEALVYHGLAWVPAIAFAILIQGGTVRGWMSGIIGLLGLIILFAGYVLFVRSVRYASYILD